MRRLLSFSVLINLVTLNLCMGQNWVPDQEGFMTQNWVQSTILDIHFLENGPEGKDYIYGKWLDQDSLVRYVACREGGRWKPLPISGALNGGGAYAMVQFADTLYVGGIFTDLVLDGYVVPDSAAIQILKIYKDSIWYSPERFLTPVYDFAASGDSLLVATSATYYTPKDTFGPHLLTRNGLTFTDPYAIELPTSKLGLGGQWNRVEIENGSIYAINLPADGDYTGVVEWDGTQWKTFGPGIYGLVSQVYDFTFYQDELYIGGSFTKNEDPRNPGEHIAKWTGSYWHSVGGGSPSPVWSFFKHDGLLYCHIRDSTFGDATIPFLAAWDGHKWCGTYGRYKYGYNPLTFGFANDTLWSVFQEGGTFNGDSLGYLNYFEGDYAKGPDAICSTPGLGEEEGEEFQEQIEVYPNPTKDKLTIQLNEVGQASLSLFDLKGALVLSHSLRNGETELQLPKGLSGVYLLRVQTDQQIFTKKVVIR